MGGMETYSRTAVERAIEIQEMTLRAVANRITWQQTGEIIGLCPGVATSPLPSRSKIETTFANGFVGGVCGRDGRVRSSR